MCVCVGWRGKLLALSRITDWKHVTNYSFPMTWIDPGGHHLESQETIQAWGNRNTSRERLQRLRRELWETQPTGSSRTCLWFTTRNREAMSLQIQRSHAQKYPGATHWAGKQERWACLWGTK